MDLKLEVAITYQQRAIHAPLGRPNLSAIARHHRVDFGFVKKIERSFGFIIGYYLQRRFVLMLIVLSVPDL